MMERLKQVLNAFKLTQGTNPDCRWDLLVERYEQTGRDLLLELKPDPEKAAVRIATGQLFDYRRFVVHPAVTDIAVLTIGAPNKLYRQLLIELNLSCIWFKDEGCRHSLAKDLLGKHCANRLPKQRRPKSRKGLLIAVHAVPLFAPSACEVPVTRVPGTPDKAYLQTRSTSTLTSSVCELVD